MSERPGLIGEITTACRVADDCLVIHGWYNQALPADGVVARPGRSLTGRFRAFAWPRRFADSTSSSWFVAAVRLPDIAASLADAVHLHGAGLAPITAHLPPALATPGRFVDEVLSRLGEHSSEALAFLLQTFTGRNLRRAGELGRLLSEFCRRVAHHDGAIEIVGWLPGGGLVMQGWTSGRVGPRLDVLLESDALQDGTAVVATFTRQDLAAPACGIFALIGGIERGETPVRRIYLPREDGYRMVEVLTEARALRPDEVSGHLRAMLPNLATDGAGLSLLRRAARPRFAGYETVSALQEPVRLAVDLAVGMPGVGVYLTGWLLDPLGMARQLSLRSPGGFSARLDDRWTRILRPDVTEGFRHDARFSRLLKESDNRHGFAVFVPFGERSRSARDSYLELELADEACAFLPLAVTEDEPAARQRHKLLGSFDLEKPGAEEVVERHLGPMFAAGNGSRGKREVPCEVIAASDDAGAEPRTEVIVPVLAGRAAPSVHLSQFGVEPLAADQRLTFVCSGELHRAAVLDLKRWLTFYGVAGRILVAEEPLEFCDALELGARRSEAEQLLFLATTVFGRDRGWLQALAGGFDRIPAAAAICPTILHEDLSVQFTGIDGIEGRSGPPYLATTSRFQGYPRGWIAEKPPAPVLAGSIDCCLLRRAAFEACGGFSDGYALPAARSLDLFLKLQRDGGRCFWLPDVEVYLLDAQAAEAEIPYVERTGSLIDGWSLAATWRQALPLAVSA